MDALAARPIRRAAIPALVVLTICVLSWSVASVGADTATGTLGVTVQVVERARITAVGDIDFGSYDPTSSDPTDASGWVEVRSTADLDYTIYISGARALRRDGRSLPFELYTDSSRATAWGDDLASGASFRGDGGAGTVHDIHARILPGRDLPQGLYRDTVTVTVEW